MARVTKIPKILLAGLLAGFVLAVPGVVPAIEGALQSAARAVGGFVTPAEAQPATVVRVVDGDTVEVAIGVSERTVRLIGVDTPESVSADESRNCEEGVAASDNTKALLPPGTQVWLVRDVSDTDRYGRLLRYVWLSEPAAAPTAEEASAAMLNAILVRDGWAEAKDFPPDSAWSALFRELGDEASREGLGVSRKWSE